MDNPTELRNRAAWYREFAAGAEKTVSRSRLRKAENMEAEADRIDAELASKPRKTGPLGECL